MIEKVNLAEKFGLFEDICHPRIVGDVADCHVKVVKLRGEFVWHSHDTEDELFLVVEGSFVMHLRDREILVQEGEFVIIPHGVEHKPVAAEEVQILLFEPKSTLNTGNVQNERTVTALEHL